MSLFPVVVYDIDEEVDKIWDAYNKASQTVMEFYVDSCIQTLFGDFPENEDLEIAGKRASDLIQTMKTTLKALFESHLNRIVHRLVVIRAEVFESHHNEENSMESGEG